MTGEDLRHWRERCGLSPLAAAEMLNLEPDQLAAYESGRSRVPDRLERLARSIELSKVLE